MPRNGYDSRWSNWERPPDSRREWWVRDHEEGFRMEVYRIGGFQEPASWTGELFLLKVKPEKPGQQLSSRERVCLASVFHLKTKEDVIMLLERVFETWSADRKLWKARLAYDTTPLMQRPGDLPERTD